MPWKDKEKKKAYQHTYYLDHREEKRAYIEAYREEIKAYWRVYYLNHRNNRKGS
jgi:hypothetical protein